MYAVRVSKNFKKGARDVELCKANRLYSLASLDNLLLPGDREQKPTITTIAERNFNNDNDTK